VKGFRPSDWPPEEWDHPLHIWANWSRTWLKVRGIKVQTWQEANELVFARTAVTREVVRRDCFYGQWANEHLKALAE